MIVSQIDEEPLKPFFNMVFYKSRNGFYTEYAEIVNDVAQSYKPVSYEALDQLFNTVKTKLVKSEDRKIVFTGMIPRNVLHFDPNALSPRITWFCKGMLRKIKYKKVKGRLFYPHLIFRLSNNELYIYAVKTTNIDEYTPLFQAPFPNIKKDENLCWGTMDIKNFTSNNSYEKIMRMVEDGFFNSTFTTDYAAGRTKSPTLPLLESLIKDENQTRFPSKELLPLNKYLRNVVHK